MRPRAEITVLPDPSSERARPDGPVRSVQAAELLVPATFLEASWTPEYLERLARAYWSYIERISLGALRFVYGPSSLTVVLLSDRIPLLRFRRPSYETAAGLGQVTWPIERGVLVAPSGRGRGRLRITIRLLDPGGAPPEMLRVRVSAEIANFYPGLRIGGRLARIGAWLYNQTQMRIHVRVTHGFLRSLARLDLPPSRVGSLRDDGSGQEPEGG